MVADVGKTTLQVPFSHFFAACLAPFGRGGAMNDDFCYFSHNFL
jgi:hypothetical protein